MKRFFEPEITVRDIIPPQSIMDEITLSAEPVFGGEELVVVDMTEEAEW